MDFSWDIVPLSWEAAAVTILESTRMNTRCDAKVFYDTEFAATVVAARRSAEWGEEMTPYQCGRHWHIAHKDPLLWGKKVSKREQAIRKANDPQK